MERKDSGYAVVVFVLAVVAALVFWAVLPGEFQENQSTDYTSFYEPVARSILSGDGVTLDGEIGTRYPPGFPLLLAGVFGVSEATGVADDTGLLLFRLLCVGLSAVLVFAMARLIWSGPLAVLAALAWATYPFGLWLAKQPNSEVPFIPLLYAGVFLLWLALLRKPGAWYLYLGAGLFTGAAMLIRPAGIGMGLVMALLVFLFAGRNVSWGTKGMAVLMIVLGNILIVAPWQATVFAETGETIPLSSGGAITIQDGLTFLAIPKDYRQEVAVADDVAAMMRSFHERRPEMDSLGGSLVVMADEAAAAPLTFGKLMAIKAGRSWYGIDSRRFELPTILLQIVYLVFIAWGSIYAWRQGGDMRRMTAGNVIIVGYFWAMTIIVVPLLRYMTPVMGLLLVALPGVLLSLQARFRPAAVPLDQTATSDYEAA